MNAAVHGEHLSFGLQVGRNPTDNKIRTPFLAHSQVTFLDAHRRHFFRRALGFGQLGPQASVLIEAYGNPRVAQN